MSDKSDFNKILNPSNQDSSTTQKDNNAPIAKVDSHSLRQTTSITEQPPSESIPRQLWISVAAYYKAKARVFVPGKELNDWLEAEKDYSEMLITAYLSVSKEDGGMTIAGLKRLAKSIGVQNTEGMSLEIEVIQAIQKITQQYPCFRSENHMPCVDDVSCEWKAECRKLIAVWRR